MRALAGYEFGVPHPSSGELTNQAPGLSNGPHSLPSLAWRSCSSSSHLLSGNANHSVANGNAPTATVSTPAVTPNSFVVRSSKHPHMARARHASPAITTRFELHGALKVPNMCKAGVKGHDQKENEENLHTSDDDAQLTRLLSRLRSRRSC